MKNKSYYFSVIHPFNLPIALALSIFGEVKYIRKILGSFCFKRFIKRQFYTNYLEFVQAKENAFDYIHPHAEKVYTKVSGHKNGKFLFEKIVKDSERNFFARDLGQKCNARVIQHTSFFPNLGEQNPIIYLFLDILWAKSVLLCRAAMSIRLLLKFIILNTHYRKRSKKIIFTTEEGDDFIPTEENRKRDIFWPIHGGYINEGKILYLLPYNLKKQTKIFLDNQKVDYLSEGDLLQAIRYSVRLSILLKYIFLSIKSLLVFRYLKVKSIEFEVRQVLWKSFFQEVEAEALVSTNAHLWPVAIRTLSANSIGMKTIIWFYSGNEFTFSPHPDHRDFSLRNSACEVDEFWVWGNEQKNLFEARRLLNSSRPKVKVLAPLMWGNLCSITESPFQLRKELGLETSEFLFYIALFDNGNKPKEIQHRAEVCSSKDPSNCEMLFKILKEVILQYPNVRILFKLKRLSSLEYYSRNSEFHKLFGKDASSVIKKQIILLEEKIDPYLPTLVSNLCLGEPFSSPVIFARELGIKAFYFDQTKRARYAISENLIGSTFYEKESFKKAIDRAIESHDATFFLKDRIKKFDIYQKNISKAFQTI